MSGIVVVNLPAVLAAFNAEETAIERAIEQAVLQAGLAVERQAKTNANTGVHKRGEPHLPGTGPGPNVVSGALRRSIKTELKPGFGKYTAQVGASMEYARAVELGLPSWRRGGGYPYLGPAALQKRDDGTINRVFVSALTRAIVRG